MERRQFQTAPPVGSSSTSTAWLCVFGPLTKPKASEKSSARRRARHRRSAAALMKAATCSAMKRVPMAATKILAFWSTRAGEMESIWSCEATLTEGGETEE